MRTLRVASHADMREWQVDLPPSERGVREKDDSDALLVSSGDDRSNERVRLTGHENESEALQIRASVLIE